MASSGFALISVVTILLNALSLDRRTHEALEDDNVKLLVITGANQKFVAGAEIASIQESIELLRNTPDRLDGTQHLIFRDVPMLTSHCRVADSMRLMEREHAWLNWLESQSKPVVAAMDTFALGGGLEVAMACHARVATRRCVTSAFALFPLSGSEWGSAFVLSQRPGPSWACLSWRSE
jgi:enoyl-CoA hydratase/carnithine racemase